MIKSGIISFFYIYIRGSQTEGLIKKKRLKNGNNNDNNDTKRKMN